MSNCLSVSRTGLSTSFWSRCLQRSALAAAALGLVGGALLAAEPEKPREPERVANVATASSPKFDGVIDLSSLTEEQKVFVHFMQTLRQAHDKLSNVSTMQCVFHKQERVDGQLQDLNIINLKVRKEPLSAYMRWETPSAGQEAIWQRGANDNLVLAHPSGWKRKIVPLIKLEPLSERAMENNRRPITEIGLWNVTRRLLEYAEAGQQRKADGIHPSVNENAKLAGRDCICFTFIYEKAYPGLDFHKVNVFFDKEHMVPIGLQNFGFPRRGDRELPLEESYVFANLQLGVPLTDHDFSADNPAYQYNGR